MRPFALLMTTIFVMTCLPQILSGYTVQRGDTLWGLSRAWNTSVDAIIAANPTLAHRDLRAGESLVRPGAAPAPSAPGRWNTAEMGSQLENQALDGRRIQVTLVLKASGQPVFAPEGGTISFVGFLPGYGHAVMLQLSGNRHVFVASESLSTQRHQGETLSAGGWLANVSADSVLQLAYFVDGRAQDPRRLG